MDTLYLKISFLYKNFKFPKHAVVLTNVLISHVFLFLLIKFLVWVFKLLFFISQIVFTKITYSGEITHTIQMICFKLMAENEALKLKMISFITLFRFSNRYNIRSDSIISYFVTH